MSASSIAYHLRSHKAVDRRLFVDLLMRFERWRPLNESVYLSMGAYPLEDHRLIHRFLGITKLIAFDLDELIVARQQFNKPIDTCKCIQRTSGQIVDELDKVVKESGFADSTSVVIWLDYTDPKDIGQQIREFQSLLDKLAVGDFVRVTVNANPKELQAASEEDAAPVLATKTMQNQFQNLRKWIGDYLPSYAAPSDMTAEGLAKILSQAFGSAALKALPVSGGVVFSPLSIARYADTSQMLSISGTLVKKSEEAEMRQSLDLNSWPFASSNWSDVRKLIVPALTLRERLFLEKGIGDKADDELIKQIGFTSAGGIDMKSFLDSYRKYYRFYPTMLPAEL